VVVGVEALDIKNDIQDGKDHEAEGQEIFYSPWDADSLIILRSAAGLGWCLAM
jgi:hypothetical protein